MDEHRGPTLHQLRWDPATPYWAQRAAAALLSGIGGADPVDAANVLELIARACRREAAALDRQTFLTRMEGARR